MELPAPFFEVTQPSPEQRILAASLSIQPARDLRDSTLVVQGGVFGRKPFSESKGDPGRNHNPYDFSMRFAGGNVKGGMKHGATDEFGFEAVKKNACMTIMPRFFTCWESIIAC